MRRPFNEWTFTHMDWLMPTERVARGPAVRPLPINPVRLNLTYRFDDRDFSLADLHRRTYTTAFVVLHHGQIVHEIYPGAFAHARVRMQLFSLSKSVTSILLGIALAEGAIGSVKDQVTDYRPEFTGTAYEGTTLADLLDMSSGVGEPEVWDVPDSAIRRFERAALSGGDIAADHPLGAADIRRRRAFQLLHIRQLRFSDGFWRQQPAGRSPSMRPTACGPASAPSGTPTTD